MRAITTINHFDALFWNSLIPGDAILDINHWWSSLMWWGRLTTFIFGKGAPDFFPHPATCCHYPVSCCELLTVSVSVNSQTLCCVLQECGSWLWNTEQMLKFDLAHWYWSNTADMNVYHKFNVFHEVCKPSAKSVGTLYKMSVKKECNDRTYKIYQMFEIFYHCEFNERNTSAGGTFCT